MKHIIAAAIFIGLALTIFLSFSSISFEFNSSPYMIVLLLLSAVAWAIAGITLIASRNILDW